MLTALAHPVQKLQTHQRAIEPEINTVYGRSQMGIAPLNSIGSEVGRFPFHISQLFGLVIFVIAPLKLPRPHVEQPWRTVDP